MPYNLGSGGVSAANRIVGRRGSSTSTYVKERVKPLTYSATVNKLLVDVEVDTTEGSVKTASVGTMEIINTGRHPAYAILAYRLWSAAATMSGTTYHVNYLLKPGESISVPNSPAVVADETIEQLAGTEITDATPSVTANYAYSDSGTTIDDASFEAADTSITVDDGDFFRVNDLIQFGINTTTATKIEICRVTAIATNVLTLERALYGTTANDKDAQTNATSGVVDNAKVYFPFFNTYGNEYNRYTVVQTDASGRFHAMNLFGAGRAATHLMGITAGSFSAKFYNAGWQNLTNDGDITSSTNSGLTASTTYYLSISIDGGTTDKITFTVDSNNTNFGGNNGIVSKLQTSIDELYYNPAKNGYEKRAYVGISRGNLRIVSGQRLSTSAISVTTNTDGTAGTDELFDTSNVIGRFPATIPTAIAAKLPDDVLYDGVTYESSPNDSVFVYDDGYGNLRGMCSGNLNYETGEINMTGCPANAEFVYSCLHTSAFSGKQNATDAAKMNSLKAIYGNMPNQKAAGELTIIQR
jgi:hypothetical protein